MPDYSDTTSSFEELELLIPWGEPKPFTREDMLRVISYSLEDAWDVTQRPPPPMTPSLRAVWKKLLDA